MEPMPHHLVGAVEIAAMLDITRQRVYQLRNEDSTFPEPEVELASGRVWRREAIERWARANGRDIRAG